MPGARLPGLTADVTDEASDASAPAVPEKGEMFNQGAKPEGTDQFKVPDTTLLKIHCREAEAITVT